MMVDCSQAYISLCNMELWGMLTSVGPEGWCCWLLLTSPPINHQKNVHQIMPSLNNYYETSLLGHTFWGSPAVAPFAWQLSKAILFYFTQNCLWDLIQCQGTEAIFGFNNNNNLIKGQKAWIGTFKRRHTNGQWAYETIMREMQIKMKNHHTLGWLLFF